MDLEVVDAPAVVAPPLVDVVALPTLLLDFILWKIKRHY